MLLITQNCSIGQVFPKTIAHFWCEGIHVLTTPRASAPLVRGHVQCHAGFACGIECCRSAVPYMPTTLLDDHMQRLLGAQSCGLPLVSADPPSRQNPANDGLTKLCTPPLAPCPAPPSAQPAHHCTAAACMSSHPPEEL
jgi:hypothetical protein